MVEKDTLQDAQLPESKHFAISLNLMEIKATNHHILYFSRTVNNQEYKTNTWIF